MKNATKQPWAKRKKKWCKQKSESNEGGRNNNNKTQKNIRITVNDGNKETNLFSDMTSGMYWNKNRHFVHERNAHLFAFSLHCCLLESLFFWQKNQIKKETM